MLLSVRSKQGDRQRGQQADSSVAWQRLPGVPKYSNGLWGFPKIRGTFVIRMSIIGIRVLGFMLGTLFGEITMRCVYIYIYEQIYLSPKMC